MPSGPPYAQHTAVFGAIPNITTDVPICAVFIALYLTCAVTSMFRFQTNRRRNHKFIISVIFTGFSMARVLTLVLRIVWATRVNDVSVSIAAMLFTNIGVFALFVANLIFAQRILRARRPHIGWSPVLRTMFVLLYVSVAVTVVVVVTFSVLSFYTLDKGLLLACRDVQLAAGTYILVIATLPFIILALAYLTPRRSDLEHFGKSDMHVKTCMLIVLTSLMVLEEGFKIGSAWTLKSYPQDDPPWYDGKPYFYTLICMLEIFYLMIVLLGRADLRFHVPNGSSKRCTYMTESLEKDVEGRISDGEDSTEEKPRPTF